MGCVKSKRENEADPPMPQEDPAEMIRMRTIEKVQMWSRELQPSEVLRFCPDFDELKKASSEDVFGREEITIIEHSMNVRGQKLRVTKSADSFDGFYEEKPKRINAFFITWKLNEESETRWRHSAYSKFWRTDRIVSRGKKGCKTCHATWKKLWAPKLSEKELFKTTGHLPANNMNPCFY